MMFSHPHLEIVLEKGTNLPKRDFTGKSDPFVVFTMGDETVKSTLRYQTLNPVWNETLILNIPEYDTSKQILVQCFDWDLTQVESMGKSFISLEGIKKNVPKNYNLKLDEESGNIELTITPKNYGEFSGKTIALLGSEESGKTTFFKHFQIKNGRKLSESLNEFHASILYWTKEIIESCSKTFEIPFKDETNVKMAEIILRATKQEDYKYKGSLFFAAPGVFPAILSLWSEPNMIETLKKKNGKDFVLNLEKPESFFSVEHLKKYAVLEDIAPFETDMKVLLKNTIIHMKETVISFESEKNEKDAYSFTLESDLNNFLPLLKDKCVLDTLNHHYFDYPEKVLLTVHPFSKYIFENFFTLPKSKIVPSNDIKLEDILSLNLTTTGKADFTGSFNDFEVCLVDLGGTEKEKQKWSKNLPPESFAIVFFIDLCSYDQSSGSNEEVTNKLLNTIERLETSAPLYKNRKLVLFFNKADKFKDKIKTKDLSKEFDEYKGGSNYDAALDFIKNLFYDALGSKPPTFVGSASNYLDVQKVIELVLEGEKPISRKNSSASPKPQSISKKVEQRKSLTNFGSSVEHLED